MSHPVDRSMDALLALERTPYPFQENGAFRVCLVFPNVYRVGMSNLGMQTVYRALNQIPGVTCERAFLPDPGDLKLLAYYKTPLFSLETRRALRDFDVVAFSLTYEMDYLNVFEILRLAAIPAESAHRGPRDPIVMAGGAAITANPLVLDPVLDMVFLGEAEVGAPELFRRLQESRGEDLETLTAGLPQLYLPGEGGEPPAEVPSLPDLEAHPATSTILTPRTVFSDTALIELTRGCPRKCSFCIAKDLYGATRTVSAARAIEYGRFIRPYAGRIGLFGAGISDHPQVEEAVQGLDAEGFEITLSSLRFDRLTPGLLRVLRRGGQRTLTVAPESFSQPVQRFLRKGFGLSRIDEGLGRVLEAGFERVKYYLMYGVPGEVPDDFEPLVSHLEKWLPRFEAASATLELSFSILEPKPRTELARLAMARRDEVRRTEEHLRRRLPRSSRLEIQWPSFSEVFLSDWLSRGDREAGRKLAAAMASGQPFRLPYREYLDEMGRILGECGPAREIQRVSA